MNRLPERFSALDRVTGDNPWKARCPAHDDRTASLSLKHDDAGKKWLIHCHAKCTTEDVVAALGLTMSDLFDEARDRRRAINGKANGKGDDKGSKPLRGKPTYVYLNADGEPYLGVLRTPGKVFPQAHLENGTWFLGKPKGPKIPYRLPELLASESIVFICEGEKDADRLASLGYTATTASEGAGKWTADLNKHFRDRDVVVLPDNDEAGRKHARDIVSGLKDVAARLRVLELPGLKEKGDVSNWLDAGGTVETFNDLVEKAPDWKPVTAGDGVALLDDVHAFLGRFIAYPSEDAHVAHTLWIAHTHLMDAWESTPRIAFLSAEWGSGKTRCLEVSELLVPRAVEAVNVTPAYLFRKVGGEQGRATLLYDEIDTVFGPKARDNEEIRGLLNAGHRRGAVAGRCVVKGKTVETEEIPAYCAVALAGIGDLPDTILSRAIVVRMKRRAPTETVIPYRRRVYAAEGEGLRNRLEAWAAEVLASVTAAFPTIPDSVKDRDADVWEPLLAIAEAVGGQWTERARVASVALVALSKASVPSFGIRLLADIRSVFGETDAMSTDSILKALYEIPESPWVDIKGKPLNDRGLAARLRKYEIKPRVVRIGESTPRGYKREDFHDAWSRYLSLAPLPMGSATSATSETDPGFDGDLPFDMESDL